MKGYINIYLEGTPYSHPRLWKSYFTNIDYEHVCNENTKELSVYHIAAAKGFSSFLWSQQFDGYYLPCASTKHYIRPHMLAYFFNHSWPFERHVPTHNFFKKSVVSLFFKITMDFHTFVFPKNSAAWGCYQYIHKIGRMTLKKIICRENLETEICSLISKLYLRDWRLVYHLYTFRKIKRYVDHGLGHSFDFISFIQHVRTKCQTRRTRYSFAQVAAYFKTKQKYVEFVAILQNS